MDGKRLIEKIKLRNILSFGDKGEEIELQPLNIIIGQNASGKSNLVDVIKLLSNVPLTRGISNFISKNGGINEWIWKGKKTEEITEITVGTYYEVDDDKAITYSLSLEERGQRIIIENEIIESDALNRVIKRKNLIKLKSKKSLLDNSSYEESILSIKKFFDDENPDARLVANSLIIMLLEPIFFVDLETNRNSEIRKPKLPDAPNDFLEEDGSNLALVLNDLEYRGDTKDKIVENLKNFNPRIKDYSIRILGGTVQLFIREEGLEKPISAMRLSDGTLRYLCLLAILCHPEPPPLICIEEPETGLHPDILPTIAELMKEASQRTQLIVTTHSDILVSAFSDMPEAVLVCEKDEDGTHFKRLNEEELKIWMEEYTDLGEIWLRGGIGGTRF